MNQHNYESTRRTRVDHTNDGSEDLHTTRRTTELQLTQTALACAMDQGQTTNNLEIDSVLDWEPAQCIPQT